MTTQHQQARQEPLLPVAEELARLFHRTYERMGPDRGYGQGVGWDGLSGEYQQMLVDVFADMEIALRPGRSVVQLNAGQQVLLLLCAGTDYTERDVLKLRDQVQQIMPDNPVNLAIGVEQAMTIPAPGEAT